MNLLFISNYGDETIGSTQEYLLRVMRKRGKVYHLRPRDGNILSQISKNKIPTVDYILMFEGELDHAPEVSKLKLPKVWWFYDSMIIFQQQVNWAKQTNADLIFNRDKRDYPKFKEALPDSKTFWLPPGYDETLWRPMMPGRNELYDVGFIGWVSDVRGRWLNRLSDGERRIIAHTEAPNTWGTTKFIHDKGPRLSYDEASTFYSSCKLGFHHSFTGDITWRPMEVSACGIPCLSDRWDAVNELFTPGKNIIIYDDDDSMKEMSDYYLDHWEEAARIGLAAHKNVTENHTWNKRLDFIENEVKKL